MLFFVIGLVPKQKDEGQETKNGNRLAICRSLHRSRVRSLHSPSCRVHVALSTGAADVFAPLPKISSVFRFRTASRSSPARTRIEHESAHQSSYYAPAAERASASSTSSRIELEFGVRLPPISQVREPSETFAAQQPRALGDQP